MSESSEYAIEMKQLRRDIDEVDHDLIELLRSRLDVVQKMGDCKRRNNVSTFQPARWKEVLRTRTEHGEAIGLPPSFVTDIFRVINEEAIQWQEKPLFEKKR